MEHRARANPSAHLDVLLCRANVAKRNPDRTRARDDRVGLAVANVIKDWDR